MPSDDPHPRRLLLISYWYPPAVGAAAERLASFARYLPDHGWHVRVLTAERTGTPAPPPGVTVHAAPEKFAARNRQFADYDPRIRPSRWRRLLRDLVFPDRFRLWAAAALNLYKENLAQQAFDAIMVSFPPASAVQLALDIRKRSPIPMVLDLRDRWLGPGGYEPRLASSRRRHSLLEREAVASAAAVTAVSDAMADAIADEHRTPRHRVFVIPNGFEPAPAPVSPDVAGVAERTAPDRYVVAHVGTVIPRNRPDLFFDSILKLRERLHLDGYIFRFVGNLSADYLRDAGLDSIVQSTGLVSRDEARREMRNADALLLLTGDYVGRWGYNAKLFEYLQAGRPILCLEETVGSNDRRLLEQRTPDRACFANIRDVEQTVQALMTIRNLATSSPAAGGSVPPALSDYRRDRLAARLASLLDSIGQRPASQGTPAE